MAQHLPEATAVLPAASPHLQQGNTEAPGAALLAHSGMAAQADHQITTVAPMRAAAAEMAAAQTAQMDLWPQEGRAVTMHLALAAELYPVALDLMVVVAAAAARLVALGRLALIFLV